VSTTHDVDSQVLSPPQRPFRCLRHHVWMAVCDDCRKQRTSVIRREKHDDVPLTSPEAAAGREGQ
jgi:hypothetical protein